MRLNTAPIASRIKSWFYRLPSQSQKNVKKYGSIAAVGLIFLGLYYGTGRNEKNQKPPETSHVIPKSEGTIISKDIVATLKDDIDTSKKEIPVIVKNALQDAIANGSLNLNNPLPAAEVNTTSGIVSQQPAQQIQNDGQNSNTDLSNGYPGSASFPAPVPYASNDLAQGQNSQDAAPKVEWVGDIYQDDSVDLAPAPAVEDSSKKGKIQLPVGFMKARLLVGVNALTGEFGSENPQTLMFRVQTPAQLPNYIKMNLAGCFAVANVNGNLSAERIITLPVSMNCITNDVGSGKKYVVEGPIKGFVSDRDGKRDMSARVVSRAGTLLASTVFTKSIEGFGNFVSARGATQNVSALGAVNTFEADKLAQSGAATGIGGGLTEVSKYLLKLVEQTAPTMETGAGKEVNLFIQETAELEIKEVRIKS